MTGRGFFLSDAPLATCFPTKKPRASQSELFFSLARSTPLSLKRLYPVELKNSAESRRVAIVIAQEPAEALATPHRTAGTSQAWLGCDERVSEALMMTLGMIVGQVLVDHS